MPVLTFEIIGAIGVMLFLAALFTGGRAGHRTLGAGHINIRAADRRSHETSL